MNGKVTAILTWLKLEEGGRQSPPPGPKYSTVARFEDQKTDWRKEAWSLVIEFNNPPNAQLTHEVQVGFLADDAPKELLNPGSKFELMEGAKTVARGVVN